jgi:hypothetical protein
MVHPVYIYSNQLIFQGVWSKYDGLNTDFVTILLSIAGRPTNGTHFHYSKGVASNENEVWVEE